LGVTTFHHSGLKHASIQTSVFQNVTAARSYDAYGMLVGASGSWSGPFGYGGDFGYQSDETGLQLLGHRYYDPAMGRFLTRDPIKDGRNWYVFCENNPITVADANGLNPVGNYIVP
jgi:RHS repeat-associated protein